MKTKGMHRCMCIFKCVSLYFRNRDKPSAEETMRIDCLPDSRKFQDYQSECLRRDCKWQADTTANGVPACFIDNNNYGYTLHNVTHPSATRTVFDLRKAHTLGYSMFGGDRLIVHLTVDMLSDELIRFKVIVVYFFHDCVMALLVCVLLKYVNPEASDQCDSPASTGSRVLFV